MPATSAEATMTAARSLLLLATLLIVAPAGGAGGGSSPYSLGTHTHLFIDDHLLDVWDNHTLRLVLNPPVPRKDPVLTADAPWERVAAAEATGGAVLGPTAPGGPLRMWYDLQANISDPSVSYIPAMAYAESMDGVTWVKPRLGVTLFAGTTSTNIVAWGINGSNISAPCPPNVWVDPNAPPHERYKTQGEFYVSGKDGRRAKVFRFAASPDGIHWSTLCDLEGMGSIDSFTTVRWSQVSGRYQMYLRDYFPNDHGGAMPIMHHYRGSRRLLSKTSAFPRVGADWVDESVTLRPDARDNATHGAAAVPNASALPPPVDFYGAVPFHVSGTPPDTLLMLVNRYWHVSGTCVTEECFTGGPGTHTDALMVSRDDGKRWRYVGDRATLLGTGMVGSWSSEFVWSMREPVTINDRMLLYYWGSNVRETHSSPIDPAAPGGRRMSGIGVAEGRANGLGSLDAGYGQRGLATTVPIVFNGSSLTLNVNCGGHGQLRVEVQDAAGTPSTCFTLARSTPIWSNGLAVLARWDGSDHAQDDGRHCAEPSIADFVGQAIRLRFELEDCKLYSFRFKTDDVYGHGQSKVLP